MYSAKRADLLLTVSEYSRKEIKRHFKITEDRIYVTSNCVSIVNDKVGLTDVKAKYGLDRYILTVSRIEPRKNHQMLLKAFLELQLYKLGYKLVIVGAMDLKNKIFNTLYKSMTDEEKESVLIFQASYLDLVALYKQAALFVFLHLQKDSEFLLLRLWHILVRHYAAIKQLWLNLISFMSVFFSL